MEEGLTPKPDSATTNLIQTVSSVLLGNLAKGQSLHSLWCQKIQSPSNFCLSSGWWMDSVLSPSFVQAILQTIFLGSSPFEEQRHGKWPCRPMKCML